MADTVNVFVLIVGCRFSILFCAHQENLSAMCDLGRVCRSHCVPRSVLTHGGRTHDLTVKILLYRLPARLIRDKNKFVLRLFTCKIAQSAGLDGWFSFLKYLH